MLANVLENVSWAGLFGGVLWFEVRDDLARRLAKPRKSVKA